MVGLGGVSLVWDGVDGVSLVFDISDVPIFVVSMVGDNLGSAIGKSNSVFTGDHSIFILEKKRKLLKRHLASKYWKG